MASTASVSGSTGSSDDRRSRVMLGPLPGDFLRPGGVDGPPDDQEALDRQAALALQRQLTGQRPEYAGPQRRLGVTVAQAKLVKNYGMTRMDPYVRLRVGHCVYETHTDSNGGKTPRWNKIINCLLPPGVNSVYLEIYDECSFTADELIAWAHVPIPPPVFQGETHEDWYRLNGKQGDAMEGMINLVFGESPYAPAIMVPNTLTGYTPMAVYPAPPPPPPPPVRLTDEELGQIREMFPSIDEEVIKSVAEANRGNKDATVNSLLQMSD